MLILYIQAHFAACRTFTAGWFRPTATFLTPSAAYGLLLNLAGLESRLCEEEPQHPGNVPATLTRPGLPKVKIALGAAAVRCIGRQWFEIPEAERFPRVQTLYQQLHNYPVGNEKIDDPDSPGSKVSRWDLGIRRAKYAKFNITPVRRELLVGLRAVVVVDDNPDLESQIRSGLDGSDVSRYGLPFVGDNSFLPDRIELLAAPPSAHWYEHVTAEDTKILPQTTRLTIWIDRSDMSRTVSNLYAPTTEPTTDIPAMAWTDITPPAGEITKKKGSVSP